MNSTKCKLCGNNIAADESGYAVCDKCGVKQLVEKQKLAPLVADKKSESTKAKTPDNPLLLRAFMFLEDGDFTRANQYFDRVLAGQPENAEAYIGKLMYGFRLRSKDEIKNLSKSLDDNMFFERALMYGDEALRNELVVYNEFIKSKNVGNSIEVSSDTKYRKVISDLSDDEITDKRNESIYTTAAAMCQSNDIEKIEEAKKKYIFLGDYKDSRNRVQECENKIRKMNKQKKAKKIAVDVFVSIVVLVAVYVGVHYWYIAPLLEYNRAEELMDDEKYAKAAVAFGDLGDYKDCEELYYECFEKAKESYKPRVYNMKADKFEDTVIVTGDGRVEGYTENGKLEVAKWRDIVDVAYTYDCIIGVKSDGTVVIAGYDNAYQREVEEWKGIVDIAMSSDHIVGLRIDGTVVAVGDNSNSCCDVEEWKNIVDIEVSDAPHTVGLKSDGTVVAVGDNMFGQCDVDEFEDIVDIDVTYYATYMFIEGGEYFCVGNGN